MLGFLSKMLVEFVNRKKILVLIYSNFNMFKIHSNWTQFESFRQINIIFYR